MYCLFSSMEYNIYISTGQRLISATSHIVLNAIEYIFKNECDVIHHRRHPENRCLASFLAPLWHSSKSLPVRLNAIPMLLKNLSIEHKINNEQVYIVFQFHRSFKMP